MTTNKSDIKGIILAGGKGTRLQPATFVMNKHMIPILNKPMILYPLETLTKVFGLKDILIVSGGDHIGKFAEFLGDGSVWNARLTYKVQKNSGGIAEALSLAKDFVNKNRSIIILGDNVFDNDALKKDIKKLNPKEKGWIFLKEVSDAKRFGVPSFSDKTLTKIIEKPAIPDTSFAVTGLYSYPPDVFDIIAKLKPSARGELEITDVNNAYISKGKCGYTKLSSFWSDAGTPESLARTIAWAARNHSS